jgi:Phosphatidylglycerophosphate synthase
MRAEKIAVNALTASRIFLSIAFCFFLSAQPVNLPMITLLFLVIAASDLADGKLARRFSACSTAGAALDVFADLFFILSSSIILIVRNVFPFWILAVILGNFLVFLVTSFLLKVRGENPSGPFFFDRLGRVVSASFYGLPFLTVLLNYALPQQPALNVISGIGIFLASGAAVSAYSRIKHTLNTSTLSKYFKKRQINT